MPKNPETQAPIRAIDVATASPDELAKQRKAVFRRLLGYIKPYKSRLAWGIFFGILAGAVNGFLVLVIRMVLDVVNSPDGIAEAYYPFEGMPIFSDFSIQPPASDSPWTFVAAVCLSIPVLLLLRGIFHYLHAYCMLWINMKVLYNLRDESFTGLIRQSLSFFNRVKQGELIQTVANQTRTTADASSQLLSGLIKHPTGILAIVVTIALIDPLYTFGALVVFPICVLPVAMVSRKVRKAGGREEQESEGLMVTLHETFSGIRLVKANGREEYQRERFNIGNKQIIKFIIRWRKAMEISSPSVEIVASLGICVGLVYAWIANVKLEDFMAVNLGLISLYPHAKALSRIQIQVQKCFVAALKVFSYIDAEPNVTDAPDAKVLNGCQGTIEFDDVTFSYIEERAALENVSLKFEAGKRYALVGQSGSGKSTILSLIMRFYDTDSGAVKVDGHNIKEYTQSSLRDQIGLVSQDTFLFHDTIENNIRYGQLDASDKEVHKAALLAHAEEFILDQVNGFDSVIGDKGCNLSGGQQQRLSIARAILRDAPILFLDEATSALDSESEKAIQEGIEELSRGKTVVAIAHRLSTVLDSDEIVVMKDGGVLDVAPHEVLLERCEEYQRLYRLQFAED